MVDLRCGMTGVVSDDLVYDVDWAVGVAFYQPREGLVVDGIAYSRWTMGTTIRPMIEILPDAPGDGVAWCTGCADCGGHPLP